MNSIEIRNGQINDKDWVWSLFCSTIKEHIERAWGWDEKFQLENFNNYLPPTEFQIISYNNSNIGAYMLLDKEDHFWLEIILIDPKYQNLGIGTKLINTILEDNCTKSKPLKFSVIKANPAVNLYKRLGFEIYEEAKDCYFMTSAYNNTLKRDAQGAPLS